jgi:hypothetical protein
MATKTMNENIFVENRNGLTEARKTELSKLAAEYLEIDSADRRLTEPVIEALGGNNLHVMHNSFNHWVKSSTRFGMRSRLVGAALAKALLNSELTMAQFRALMLNGLKPQL